MQEKPKSKALHPAGLSAETETRQRRMDAFRSQLQTLSKEWLRNGTPAQQELGIAADQLEKAKKALAIEGIWESRPLMVTATLDDGLGQGLRTIHRFGDIIGLEIHPLGLLQSPDAIIAACQRHVPRFLGLTVLQLDSDDDLGKIGKCLPDSTRLIAGGPVFFFDKDMALRCSVHAVCPDVAHFIDYMCSQAPYPATLKKPEAHGSSTRSGPKRGDGQ